MKEVIDKVVVRILDSKDKVIKRKKEFTSYDELMNYIDSNLELVKNNDYVIEVKDYIKNKNTNRFWLYAYGQIFYSNRDKEFCNYDHAKRFYKVFLSQDPNLTHKDLRLAGGIDMRLL